MSAIEFGSPEARAIAKQLRDLEAEAERAAAIVDGTDEETQPQRWIVTGTRSVSTDVVAMTADEAMEIARTDRRSLDWEEEFSIDIEDAYPEGKPDANDLRKYAERVAKAAQVNAPAVPDAQLSLIGAPV